MIASEQHSSCNNTRDKILEAATTLFAERGLEGVSIRDISRLASVNVSAVNYYFQSKEQLYLEIITGYFSRMGKQLSQLDKEEIEDEEDYIRRFVEYNLDLLFNRDREMELIVARELSVPSSRRDRLARDYFSPALKALTRVIRRGISRSRFRRVDADLAALSLVGMCVFYANKKDMFQLILESDTLTDQFRKRATRQMSELFLRGIRKQ